MIVSVPKPDCAVTQDAEWDCPQCFWTLRGIEKGFWHKCLPLQPSSTAAGAGGAYRVEILSNTALFPFKPASYCHREHYTVVIHKKSPASVRIFAQPKAKISLAVLTVEHARVSHGKQKVHYLTELSIENKRQYCAQQLRARRCTESGARTPTRWDKVMLLSDAVAVSVATLGRPGHTLHERRRWIPRLRVRPARGQGRQRPQHRLLLRALLAVVARVPSKRVGAQWPAAAGRTSAPLPTS